MIKCTDKLDKINNIGDKYNLQLNYKSLNGYRDFDNNLCEFKYKLKHVSHEYSKTK